MINPKNTCIAAAVGFVLSFIVGAVSEVAFLYVILRAFIFAAVFAVVSVGISYLYKNFLSDDQPLDSSSSGESSSSKNSSGGFVNIVVDDSTLRDDSSAPKFSVTNPNVFGDESLGEKNNEEISNSASNPPEASVEDAGDVRIQDKPKIQPEVNNPALNQNVSVQKSSSEKTEPKQAKKSTSQNEKSGANSGEFVSADLSQLTSNSSHKNDAKTSVKSEKSAQNMESRPSAQKLPENSASQQAENQNQDLNENDDEDEIDELPDISGIDLSAPKFGNDGIDGDDIIEDSEFASEGAPSASAAAGSTGGQDINTMAQAIRTLLAKDKE